MNGDTMRAVAAAAATVLIGGAIGACGGNDASPAKARESSASASRPGEVVRLGVVPKPGVIKFDRKRVVAEAGPVTFELVNPVELGHNVRIQSGKKCCFGPDSKDLGGTDTIGKGTARATVTLEPGRYFFLCAIGGHWQRGQRGVLIVR